MKPQQASFGTWSSPMAASAVATASVAFSETRLHRGTLFWVERRPDEGGRSVLVAQDGNGVRDVLPRPFDLRSRVHEYGGGVWGIDGDQIWFVDAREQAIYRQVGGRAPQRVVAGADCGYADLQVRAERGLCIAVRESHDSGEAHNDLVAIAADGTIRVLHHGHDFYASPRISPDGTCLAWLTWDHPDMPWDATRLWRARIRADGGLSEVRCMAGEGGESLFQPQWSPGGDLYVVSDRSDWWNLYRVNPDGGDLTAVALMEAEFGLPQWVFGQSTYAFPRQDRIFAVCSCRGMWRALHIDLTSGAREWLEMPFTQIGAVSAEQGEVAFVAGSSRQPTMVYRVDEQGRLHASRPVSLPCDAAYLSQPQPITYDSSENEQAHGLYYAPTNPDYAAPQGELPPLLVKCHGGPTGATEATLNPRIQFWTSRGFAVLDVNYRGSTGYGRRYRRRLYGRWGELDVDDCVFGAQSLIDRGLADPERVLISGSSAGGFTVLCALTFRDLFAGGASYYGIGDLTRLLESTHKFESRYLDRLVGPYTHSAALYRARSPLCHAAQLDCPVIFLQGLMDKVVPPDQAHAMVDALRARRLPVALVTFADESHGFRNAANIRTALEAELFFYGRILDFAPADVLTPVPIDNLPQHAAG